MNIQDSADEAIEEKDHFVAQLYKFMDDSGTPLNKSPTIGNRDVDLYRLFRLVEKLGGYNRVTNQNKWRTIANRLKFSNSQTHANQVKSVYKKFLLSYESFHRTLGVTMLNHPRTGKKSRGRSLIRDRDRATPVSNSPKLERDEEVAVAAAATTAATTTAAAEKKQDSVKVETVVKSSEVVKVKEEESSDDDEPLEASTSSGVGGGSGGSAPVGRPKRLEKKTKGKSERVSEEVVVKKEDKKEESDDKVRKVGLDFFGQQQSCNLVYSLSSFKKIWNNLKIGYLP